MVKKTALATITAAALFTLGNVAVAQGQQRGGDMHSSSHGAMSGQSVSTSATAGSDASRLGQGVVGGGVGVNARARLSDQAAPDHNVKLVFSLSTGNSLADVDVKVTDRSGNTVIDGVSPGPWLYATLPAGTYTANASYMGETVTEKFTVGRSGQRVAHLRWPAKVELQSSAAHVQPILGTGPQEVQR
jgi:hypothetical protein